MRCRTGGKECSAGGVLCSLNIHSIEPHEEGLCRVNVGEIHAGLCANTIAPEAMMRVEYRGQNENISDYLGRRVRAIIKGTAAAYELEYRIVDIMESSGGRKR